MLSLLHLSIDTDKGLQRSFDELTFYYRPIAILGAACVAGLQMLTEVSNWEKHMFVQMLMLTNIARITNVV